jgi:signal transduction histidine kinase
MMFSVNVLKAQCNDLLEELMATSDEARTKEIIKNISMDQVGGAACEQSAIQKFLEQPSEPKRRDLMLRMVSGAMVRSETSKIISWGRLALKALKNEKGIEKRLGSLCTDISAGYINMDKLDSALFYCQLSESYYVQAGESESLWKPNFNKYRVYLALKNFKKADFYLNKCYSYVKDSPNRMNKGFVLHSMLIALKARGDKKVFEQYLKEYIQFKKQGKGLNDMRHLGMDEYFTDAKEAKETLERVIQAMIKDSIKGDKASYRGLLLSDLYEEDNEFEKAEKLYLDLLRLPSIPQERKNYYKNLYNLYKKQGNSDKAYNAIENYIAVQDSSFQQIFDGKIADYEVKYQTQEKEKEILRKNLELIQVRNRQRNLVGLAVIALVLAGGLFYFYQRRLKYQREMKEKDMQIQKQKIAELEQKNKLLALNSMIEGQESERLRIAQDLHDGLGGLLTTVKAHFNAIEREIANIKNMNVYEKTNQLIDEACAEVRRIAHDMVPHSLKMNGLHGVLSDIQHSVKSRGVACDVEIHHLDESILGEQKAVMIYRIVQEVVNNAMKHANASHLLIQLIGHENGLNVMIEDNGKGFDINSLIGGKGMGLKSIESRVKYLEGTLNIDSAPSQGTTINIEIPIQRQNKAI